jgi:hypothetical protein
VPSGIFFFGLKVLLLLLWHHQNSQIEKRFFLLVRDLELAGSALPKFKNIFANGYPTIGSALSNRVVRF